MIDKEHLLRLLKKETATTIKAMRAFPGDKLDFTPHERSQNARRILSLFVFEMMLIESYSFGEEKDRSRFKSGIPGDLEEIIRQFEKESSHVVAILAKSTDQELDRAVEFAGAKSTARDFMLMMLFDQIHHRGQLSVYIRMAGGKVPSIYGPSADDTSTNL